MTDLSSAEPGDTVIVALKVMRKEINSAAQTKVVVAVPGGGFWAVDEKIEVRAIEKAPKPFKVGERVVAGLDSGEILAVYRDTAWVKWDCGIEGPSTLLLNELRRVP